MHDAQAFSQLYDETHLQIYRFIFSLHGGPVEDVEDLTAETYARAWKARRQFSGNANAALGWLIQIARNLVIDDYRRNKNRKVVSVDEEYFHGLVFDDFLNTPETQLEIQQQFLTLWNIVQSLPINQKELITLRYVLGWRVNRIAVHLGLLENTVSVQIRRIIISIREVWPEK